MTRELLLLLGLGTLGALPTPAAQPCDPLKPAVAPCDPACPATAPCDPLKLAALPCDPVKPVLVRTALVQGTGSAEARARELEQRVQSLEKLLRERGLVAARPAPAPHPLAPLAPLAPALQRLRELGFLDMPDADEMVIPDVHFDGSEMPDIALELGELFNSWEYDGDCDDDGDDSDCDEDVDFNDEVKRKVEQAMARAHEALGRAQEQRERAHVDFAEAQARREGQMEQAQDRMREALARAEVRSKRSDDKKNVLRFSPEGGGAYSLETKDGRTIVRRLDGEGEDVFLDADDLDGDGEVDVFFGSSGQGVRIQRGKDGNPVYFTTPRGTQALRTLRAPQAPHAPRAPRAPQPLHFSETHARSAPHAQESSELLEEVRSLVEEMRDDLEALREELRDLRRELRRGSERGGAR